MGFVGTRVLLNVQTNQVTAEQAKVRAYGQGGNVPDIRDGKPIKKTVGQLSILNGMTLFYGTCKYADVTPDLAQCIYVGAYGGKPCQVQMNAFREVKQFWAWFKFDNPLEDFMLIGNAEDFNENWESMRIDYNPPKEWLVSIPTS